MSQLRSLGSRAQDSGAKTVFTQLFNKTLAMIPVAIAAKT